MINMNMFHPEQHNTQHNTKKQSKKKKDTVQELCGSMAVTFAVSKQLFLAGQNIFSVVCTVSFR